MSTLPRSGPAGAREPNERESMPSKIKSIETQGCASPVPGLTRVALLTHAPDGWRVYEAFCPLRLDHWEEDKAEAVAWTKLYGNKLSREEAGRYFRITADMTFA